MALTDKLTAIADAIREKTGKTDPLTLDNMPVEIRSMSLGNTEITSILNPSDYKSYIQDEMILTVQQVKKVLKDDSIVFIALSDSHYIEDNGKTHQSGYIAVQAIKALTYLLPIDFIAHLGDVGSEHVSDTQTSDALMSNSNKFLTYLKEAANNLSIPLFVAIGNHDAGDQMENLDTKENRDILKNYLQNNYIGLLEKKAIFGTYEVDDSDLDSGFGYGYRDIGNLRVFLLNTCEKTLNDSLSSGCMGAYQINWMKEKIAECKSTHKSFIILSHYPLDFSTVKNEIGDYLYQQYTSENNTSLSRFLGSFHGHLHCYLYDNLHQGSLNEPWGIPRFCTPSTECGRENSYVNLNADSSDGYLYGIKFFEGTLEEARSANLNSTTEKYTALHGPTYLTKQQNSQKNTSFNINVINPSEDKIYSFFYGAGKYQDEKTKFVREMGYNISKQKYIIETNFTNINSSNTSSFVYEGKNYYSVLTAFDGYRLDTAQIVIKMNNIDITSSVYNYITGEINISEVTGDIKIIASALDASYYSIETNLINVKNSNPSTKIQTDNPIYQTTLSYRSDAYMKTFSLFMGTEDLSNSSYITKNEDRNNTGDNTYTINIPLVTGPIKIVAEAQLIANFTNAVTGYTNNKYLGATAIADMNGFVLTDYIKVPPGKEKIIRVLGENINLDSTYTRIVFYDENKTSLCNPMPLGHAISQQYPSAGIIEEEPLTVLTWKFSADIYPSAAWIRFCTSGLRENLIITINEPITYGDCYSIIQNLSNVVSSNQIELIDKNKSWLTEIRPKDENYYISSLSLSMGGVLLQDLSTLETKNYISELAGTNGYLIVIENVEGDIEITAKGSRFNATNLSKIATDVDGISSYGIDGCGYVEGKYISGKDESDHVVDYPNFIATGWIPYTQGQTIKIINSTINSDNHCRLFGYPAVQYAPTLWIRSDGYTDPHSAEKKHFSTAFTVTVDGNITTLTPNSTHNIVFKNDAIKYIRLSLPTPTNGELDIEILDPDDIETINT